MMEGGNQYAEKAEKHLKQAESLSDLPTNAGEWPRRRAFIDYELRVAQIYATLAAAQSFPRPPEAVLGSPGAKEEGT